ncbi:MAG: hypothetical protein KGL59_05080 [Acidobacteriota bacterium]|nr:hypothetical protein [Acidobacteriota bacterium]
MSRKDAVRKERSEDPERRDAYLKKCGEQADDMLKALEQNKGSLCEEEYLSIAETAEYLENESSGIEGIDF